MFLYILTIKGVSHLLIYQTVLFWINYVMLKKFKYYIYSQIRALIYIDRQGF